MAGGRKAKKRAKREQERVSRTSAPPPGPDDESLSAAESVPPDAAEEEPDGSLDAAVAFAGVTSGEAALDGLARVPADGRAPASDEALPAAVLVATHAPTLVISDAPTGAQVSSVQVVRHSVIPIGGAPDAAASGVSKPSISAPIIAAAPVRRPEADVQVEPALGIPTPPKGNEAAVAAPSGASASANAIRASLAPVRPSNVPGAGFQRPTSVLDARPSLQPDSVPAPSGIGWGALAGIAVMAAIVAAAAVIAIRERLATREGSETAAMTAQQEPSEPPAAEPNALAPNDSDEALDNQPAAADPAIAAPAEAADAALASGAKVVDAGLAENAGDAAARSLADSQPASPPAVVAPIPVVVPVPAPSVASTQPTVSKPATSASAAKPVPAWRQQLRAQQAAASAARAAARAAAARSEPGPASPAAPAPVAPPASPSRGEIPADPYADSEPAPSVMPNAAPKPAEVSAPEAVAPSP